MKSKESPIKNQIKSQISDEDFNKLEYIVKTYRFKSMYQLLQTLIKCFIKVADPQEDEVVNIDIEKMFAEIFVSNNSQISEQ